MSFPHYWAVVPAAGIGTRFAADLPKQYLLIKGEPVISYALSSLLSSPLINKVVIALNSKDAYWQQLSISHHPKIVTVLGGSTRQESVLRGLEQLQREAAPKEEDWVLVHDAARPCLRQDELTRLINGVNSHPVGGILGLPITDTIKQININNEITATVDRNILWRALTPQMFRYAKLLQALQFAQSSNKLVTDEANAMELLGYYPLIIPGNTTNIKLTYPSDLQLAEFLLSTDRPD